MSVTQLNTTSNSVVDYSEMEQVAAQAIFPELFEQGSTAMLKRRKHRHPDCISSNSMYVPDAETAKLALVWLMAPKQMLSLGLQGHTGTGKTELALYLADKLNLPIYIVKIHARMNPQDLEGSYVLDVENGQTVTRKEYGPAAKAYLNGGILLLDEFDKASGELTSAMHLLVEGKPWPLEMFKETIQKHDQCFCIGTANTYGAGHDERYITSNQMDSAFLSRFMWLETHYPNIVQESIILEKFAPRLPLHLRNDAIKLANAFRDAALGVNRDGNVDDPIQCIFSTRVLVAWVYYIQAFGAFRTLKQSLDSVFLKSVPADDADIANEIVNKIFGDDINKPLKEILAKK
ncbi:AAA family ATPase [Shewanella sp. SW32]|uniref:AAA family ATPase n=1 Tax=Shewanella TaxID=22 RepID=UPI0021DAC4A9|nr:MULTISPECIES: AAA family ATPase [unclassified Shewanella]MCU7962118.1 AAA family ATPase [Shewanella sp. SW32]MCU7970050.1 AAA family ATPase [Shewanella sp. SW29]MCU8056158.1 AAA family ATPase [Shewanella sp. SM35]MCU8065092.1 AAA family ATPase [Shewanella sp. SM34]